MYVIENECLSMLMYELKFINLNLKPLLKTKSVVYDVKGVLGNKANAKL